MRLGVRFDLEAFKRDLDKKGRQRVYRAAGIALGRVGVTVRKIASQSIRERLAISAAVAKKAITIRRQGKALTLFVEAAGRPIPIRDYQAKAGKKGVTYRVRKGDKRKAYRSKYGAAFVVSKVDDQVFVRVGPRPKNGSAPIRIAYGPSIPQYFVTRVIRELMQSTARQRWPIEFAAAWRGLSIRAGGPPEAG